jgi:hypothetical protein
MSKKQVLNSFGGLTVDELQTDFVKDKMIIFLRQLFKSHPTHPWKDDAEETKIDIIDEWSVNRKTSGRKPSLVVQRGGTRHLKLGIRNLRSYRWAKDVTDHVGAVESTLRVSCISKLPLESERFGSQVFSLLRNRKYDFMELTLATNMTVVALSPRTAQIVTSAPEQMDTPVDVVMQHIERWVHVNKQEPVLGGIDFDTEYIDP